MEIFVCIGVCCCSLMLRRIYIKKFFEDRRSDTIGSIAFLGSFLICLALGWYGVGIVVGSIFITSICRNAKYYDSKSKVDKSYDILIKVIDCKKVRGWVSLNKPSPVYCNICVGHLNYSINDWKNAKKYINDENVEFLEKVGNVQANCCMLSVSISESKYAYLSKKLNNMRGLDEERTDVYFFGMNN